VLNTLRTHKHTTMSSSTTPPMSRLYRKHELYTNMVWSSTVSDLDRYLVTAAPYGGPVATVRNPKKVLLINEVDEEVTHPVLRIFSSSGVLLSEVEFTRAHALVSMGWTETENLLCVFKDGMVHMYNIHGDTTTTFSMGSAVKERGVADAVIWPSGVVIRVPETHDLIAVSDLEEPRPQQLMEPGITRPPTCLAVIPPEVSRTGAATVLVGTPDGSLITTDDVDAVDEKLTTGPFSCVAVSPNGDKVACFNEDGVLHVYSADFKENLFQFKTESKLAPLDMVWCGPDAVALHWPKVVLLASRYNSFVSYSYEGIVKLVEECDGIRVLSPLKCDFIQPIPQSIREIRTPGSMAPSAWLHDAYESYEGHDAKAADEKIRRIKSSDDTMVYAINQCIDAAAHEFEHDRQQSMLKAASFGALFAGDADPDQEYDPDLFVHTCRELRVLNAVRDSQIGMPLSYDQYRQLDADVVIDRLANRHHHLLAMRVCSYLRIPPERVLVHWACTKIKLSEEDDDEKLASEIQVKLSEHPSLSYAEIATTAFHSGRRRLATMMLEHEPRASKQVPLLMRMNEDELALAKAIASGDTDLVYYVLLSLIRHRPEDLFPLIKDKPLARSLLVSYARENDRELLRRYYREFALEKQAATIAAYDAYEQSDWHERMRQLEISKLFFKRDSNLRSHFDAMSEQMSLLEHERERELTVNQPYVDKSVSELLEMYVSQGDIKMQKQLRRDFKLDERHFWHIRVRTLANCKAWDELENMAKSRSPVGFEPFVEACVANNAKVEAAKYIRMLSDHRTKLEWLCNLDMWKDAAQVADAAKDPDALVVIRHRCRRSDVEGFVDELLKKYNR
jgi:vacuolar protein sorting-associated protein 16